MNECIKCRYCDKTRCEHIIPKKNNDKENAIALFLALTILDIIFVAKLYMYWLGSQDYTNAIYAYGCREMMFPTAIVVAITTTMWLLGLIAFVCIMSEGKKS